MKELRKGHKYLMDNFDNPENAQVIQFIEKEPINKDDHPEYWADGRLPENGTLHLVNDGTTNEEVLGVLINRMDYLQECFPCNENLGAIKNLESALMWLKSRTKDRKKRKVEGMHLV